MTVERYKTTNSSPFCHPELVSGSKNGMLEVIEVINRIVIVTDVLTRKSHPDAEINSA